MRSLFTYALLPLLASSSPLFGDAILAPIITSETAKHLPDSYIIVFKDHVTHSSAADHHDWVHGIHRSSENVKNELRKRSLDSLPVAAFNGLKHTYSFAGDLFGYSGHFDEDVIEQIRRHPDVEYVERDSEIHTTDDGELEKFAPWGLARISHRKGLSFSTFNKYLYAHDGGEGVDVYVVDTGTNVDHADFGGRASWGSTIPEGDSDTDGNGHGTHCSGTIAGKKYGVAKLAHIKAVKVLRSNGSGSMSDVVKGVEYVVESHLAQVEAAKKGKRKGFKGSTANMSLGGGKSTLLDKAVNVAVENGVHFAVAAGNDNADSCNYSPAGAKKAVTVGASDLFDARAGFSNYGPCNDIFAPGVNIESTWIGSEYAINTISGTSMASPHIAGLLAYMLSLQPSKDSDYGMAEITPKKLKAELLAIATKGALSDVSSDTANLLAWNGGGSSNYTEIVEGGGYDMTLEKAAPLHDLKGDFDLAVEKLKAEAHTAKENAAAIEDMIIEDIREVFEEVEEIMESHRGNIRIIID